MTDSEFRIITPIPDTNTSEAIVYGSAYRFAKSSKFFWDQLEDMIRKDIEDLKGQLIDPEFCSHVLNSPGLRSMIFRKSPPVSDPNQIKDLWTLRRISNMASGLNHLDALRKQNMMWATMKGVGEYTKTMMEQGISDRQWKVASDGIDMPIEYSTVRGIIDRDEHLSEVEVSEMAQDMEARRRECEQFEADLENYRRLNREAVEEDEELPEIPIYREIDDDSNGADEVSFEISKDTPFHALLTDIFTNWLVDDLAILSEACSEMMSERTPDEVPEETEETPKVRRRFGR